MEFAEVLQAILDNIELICAIIAGAVAIWQKTQGSKLKKVAAVLIMAIEEYSKDTGDKKIKKLIKDKQVPELDSEVKKTISG